MTSLIHPSSTVSKSVQIGENVKVGPFCNIDGNIIIGDGTELKSHVSILSLKLIAIKTFPTADLPSADFEPTLPVTATEISDSNLFFTPIDISFAISALTTPYFSIH